MNHFMKGYSVRLKIIFPVFILLLTKTATAQNNIPLLEIDTVREHLALSEGQYKTVNKIVEQIKRILEQDHKIIADLKARFKSGDEPGFFEKIKVKQARDGRVDRIDKLFESINNHLNDKQKIRFKEVEKPVLRSLSKKELTE